MSAYGAVPDSHIACSRRVKPSAPVDRARRAVRRAMGAAMPRAPARAADILFAVTAAKQTCHVARPVSRDTSRGCN